MGRTGTGDGSTCKKSNIKLKVEFSKYTIRKIGVIE